MYLPIHPESADHLQQPKSLKEGLILEKVQVSISQNKCQCQVCICHPIVIKYMLFDHFYFVTENRFSIDTSGSAKMSGETSAYTFLDYGIPMGTGVYPSFYVS